jgi:hypothetical protein
VAATGTTPPILANVALGIVNTPTAGNDGTLIGPADAAFHTAVSALFGVGTVTDRIELFNLVSVPGLTDPTTIAALQLECRRRRAFLIVDAPDGETVASMPAIAVAIAGPGRHELGALLPVGARRRSACPGCRSLRSRRRDSSPASMPAPTRRAASGRRRPAATPRSAAPSASP